ISSILPSDRVTILSPSMHFPWSTWAMMPMLRIWSLLETIFRMSAELLKRGNESYLSSRGDSANPYSSLLYVSQGNHCHLYSFQLELHTKLVSGYRELQRNT